MEKKKRGNQGWSTAPGAGRPKSPGPARTNRTIRASDDEYKLIKRYIELVREKPDIAKKILDKEDEEE